LSFWDRLGTLAQDTVGAVTASPKFLWDIASAPWNDNEEFNGFANTFKTSGTKWAQAMIKPIADVAETPGIKQGLQKLDTFNREVIREPLTTGLLAATETGGDFKKAYGMAQDTSLGQAIVGSLGAILPGQQAVDKIDYEDTAAVDKFFSTGAPRFWSGVGDVSIQIFGDVSIAGGKAAKIARESSLITNKINNGRKAAKAINDFADAGNGVVNKYTPLLENFVANGAEYARNHPMIRKSPMADTAAYGLGQADNMYDASLVMRAALADPRALEELQVVRASIGNPMARQQGILDPYQEFLLKKSDDPTGIASLPHTDQVVVQDAIKELEDLRNTDAMFAAWEQMAKTPGGVINRTVGARPMQAIDDFLAKGRSAKFVAGGTRAEAWQPTPFHRMYQVVSWLGNERPAGIVNLNEAESSAEVMAFVNRAHRIAGDDMYTFLPNNSDVLKQFKGVTDERAAGMMANYYRATSPEERAIALSIIENAGFSAICGKYGIDRATANEIYQNHWRSRMGAQESLRKNGFMIDENGSLISAPVFESQTANYLPMMDLDILNSVLKQHKIASKSKSLARIYGLGNEVTGAMDILQVMFKAGVLMRLGYTIRNGTEAQLRIAASVGSMASMRHLGPGIKNLALNSRDTLAARTVDRLSISGGPATYQSTKRSLDKVDSELGDLQAKYQGIADEYNKQLDEFNGYVPPEDPIFTSTKFTDEEVNQLDQGILPERLGFKSEEYQKAAKAEAKRLADEHRAIIDPDIQAKIDEASSAFNLDKTDISLLETKGLIPLNKILDAYEEGSRLGSDELSGIISTGKIESASLDGPLSQDYVYYPEGDLKYLAVQNGKSRRKYIEVPWRRQTREEYVSDGIAQFDSYYEMQVLERSLVEYTDEANAWYGQNATQTYSPITPNVQLESDMRVIEKAIADKKSVREDYANQLTALEKSAKRGEKRKIGQGKWKVKSAFGDNYDDFYDGLGGQFADIHRTNASAENSMNTLVDDNAGLFSRSLTKTGYGEVKPDAPNYYQAWSDALNYQFRNSDVAMKLMEDGADPAAVAKYLRIDPEGRITAKRLNLDPWEIDSHVAAVKGFVDSYIPSRDLRQLLINSEDSAPISPDMLRGTFTGTDGLPTIHGHILEENLNLVSRKHAQEIVNGVFRLIGSMPEDLIARHPLYISLYRTELQRRVKMFEGMNERRLTSNEMDEAMSVTHKVALRQLKDTLFTIDRKTNLAHYMRFISPFFSAFENTAKTWAKITYEKPQTINRANLIFTSPNRAGIATDENGNPVPPEEASINDYIWLEVPKSLQNAPFIGKGLTSLTQMGIQKRSLDVIFQGDIAQIPVGPYVAIPISEMVKRKPELEDSLKWAIPFGPERNAVRAFLPAWVKRQLTKQDGQSNQQYANTYALIWTTEQHKRREAGQPAATAVEVQKMTDAYYNMRTVANLILPFAPTFNTPYKFYVDQWRQYQEQFGMEAQTKYWQDYGDDFFEFTQSLSKNTTGSFASIGSVGNAKAHADLISELSLIDPKLIGIVTNAGQAYDFSQAAYMWQQANTISPSSSETYRTRKDPAEAALDNERSLGWIKYRDVMANIDSEMQRRGLTNLQSKKAADLASMKKQLVAQLGSTNTAWYDDYLDTDGSKTNKIIRGLETIVNNEKFMSQYGDNPTFKSIAVYLDVRKATEKALASRPSKSIDAQANADIKYAFESVANQLKQQDIGFGDLYDRWLSYDSVYDAVHSQGVAQ